LVPIRLYETMDHFTEDIQIGGISCSVFYGMDGSPAYMDSYSGTVLLLNLLIYKGPQRQFFIALSLFFVMYTLKMTPLAGLLVSLLCYYPIRNRNSALIAIITGNLLFVLVCYWLLKDIDPIDVGISFKDLMCFATHARTMIWEQHLSILLKEYKPINYLLGGYDSEL